MSLKGKSALVTGSTSGIGLGVATAYAAQGCNIMLNGLGDAAEIEKTRAGLAAKYGVKVLYNGANMLNPDDIRAIAKEIQGAKGYFLQAYRDSGDILKGGCSRPTDGELHALLSAAREYLPNAELRGVE